MNTTIQHVTAADAEIACIRGDAETLSRYLRAADKISLDVVQNIAGCLLADLVGSNPGPGNWILTFKRNGRPPRRPDAINAELALRYEQAIPLGMHLATQGLNASLRRALADALDPENASTGPKLKFRRPRRGNPRTDLRTELQRSLVKHIANATEKKAKLRAEALNNEKPRWDSRTGDYSLYPEVIRNLRKFGVKAGKSTIRAARNETPPGGGRNKSRKRTKPPE